MKFCNTSLFTLHLTDYSYIYNYRLHTTNLFSDEVTYKCILDLCVCVRACMYDMGQLHGIIYGVLRVQTLIRKRNTVSNP